MIKLGKRLETIASLINDNNKFLKYTFKVLNIFKLPFPTIEYNTGGDWVWHWIYF